MSLLSEHPTVKRFQERINSATPELPPQKLASEWLRQLCFDAGADDVGFVEIDRPELADQRAEIIAALSPTKTLVSFVCRMNREDVRSPARSVANLEFHHTGDEVNDIARKIVADSGRTGYPSPEPSDGLPDGDGPLPPGKYGSCHTSRSRWRQG